MQNEEAGFDIEPSDGSCVAERHLITRHSTLGIRHFLVAWSLVLLAGVLGADPGSFSPVHEADFYEAMDRNIVRCLLCPHQCIIAPGRRGICRVRENKDGKLYSVVYGRPCTIGKEPIEKAPFFHFLPGRTRFVLATAGCNQTCKYCQNWELSQSSPEDLPSYDLPPDRVVEMAERKETPIICFTFSEPVVFYEYVCDVAVLARKKGIKTAVVTGGYINPEPLRKLCGLVDAIKIDLKGFTDEFYREVCGSSLNPVLEACRIVAQSDVHLELVNLVVPALNDDTADIRRMCCWIRDSLGSSIPIHFTRFSPAYRLRSSPPTPVRTLETAAEIARQEGLNYVYIGNVPGHRLESTFCPNCDSILIHRQGFSIIENNLVDGNCPFCGERIPGVWQ